MEFLSSLGIKAIPVITVIVFVFVEAAKLILPDEKWCPVIAGVAGGILGVVAMYVMVDFQNVDILTAVAMGIISGLAATGAHQVYKQLTQKGEHEI